MADEPMTPAGHDVTVNIKGSAEGLKKAAKEAEDHVAGLRLRLNSLGQGGIGVAQIIKSIGLSLSDLPKVAGLGVLISQLNEIRNVGAVFAIQMEQTALGLKAVYAQQIAVMDAEGKRVDIMTKLAYAQGEMSSQIEKMKTDALVTTATFSEIKDIFQGALPVALSLGMSLDQTRGFVVTMVKAAGAMGVPIQHLNMEVRDALQGYVQMEDRMLRALGLTTERLQQWKAQGPDVLVGNLLKKMEAFDAASKEAGDTWQGVTSSLQDFKEQLSGMAVTPALDVMKRALIQLRDAFGEVKNEVFVFNEQTMAIVTTVQTLFTEVTKAGVALTSGLLDVAAWVVKLNAMSDGWLGVGAAIYGVLTALQLFKGIVTAPWFISAMTSLAASNPLMLWGTVAIATATTLFALWRRFFDTAEEDISELEDKKKAAQSEVEKSKQRSGGLAKAIATANDVEEPKETAENPLFDAASAEAETTKKLKDIITPLAKQYPALVALLTQTKLNKKQVIDALRELNVDEEEFRKTQVEKSKIAVDEQIQKKTEAKLKADQELKEAKDTLAERQRQYERLSASGAGSTPEDFRGRGALDELAAQIEGRKNEPGLVQKVADAATKAKTAEAELAAKQKERLEIEQQLSSFADVPETEQDRKRREKTEDMNVELFTNKKIFEIDQRVLEVQRSQKLAATGYYLAAQDFHRKELEDLNKILKAREDDAKATNDAAKIAAIQHLNEVQRNELKERQLKERMDLMKAIASGELEGPAPVFKGEMKDSKGNVVTGPDGKPIMAWQVEESFQRKTEQAKLMIRQRTFQQEQQDEMQATRAQIMKDIETAEAEYEKVTAELVKTRTRAIKDPMLKPQVTKLEEDQRQAQEKVARVVADSEVKIAEVTKKQYEGRKAEEERQLQHRKAMGQMTEQDELDRLFRLSQVREEDYKSRDKAAEQHFEKWKSLEQGLFDYRKGMGLISLEMEINRLRAISGAANRTAEERMAAEQKVYDLEKQLQEKRRSGAKNMVNMAKEYLKEKYGEAEANKPRTQEEWGKVADEAIGEKQRQLDRLKGNGSKTADEMQKMYDLDKELSDMRASRKEIGTPTEQIKGGTVPTPEADEFRRMKHERDILFNKQSRTAEEEQRLKDLNTAIPEQYKRVKTEEMGETKTQREAAAGTSPASPAFAAVAKALGLDMLPGQATKAFEEVATSYQALLDKMVGASAVAGAKMNTALYEGFVSRLKNDLMDEVNRS